MKNSKEGFKWNKIDNYGGIRMRKTESVIVTCVEEGRLTVDSLITATQFFIYDEAATAYAPGHLLLIDRNTKEIANDISNDKFN